MHHPSAARDDALLLIFAKEQPPTRGAAMKAEARVRVARGRDATPPDLGTAREQTVPPHVSQLTVGRRAFRAFRAFRVDRRPLKP